VDDGEERARAERGDPEPPAADPAGAAGAGDADPRHEAASAVLDGNASAPEPGGRDPRRFNEWRKRSTTGVVMSGIALGLREALELPDQRPALVVEAPGEPDDPDRAIDLHFDPDDPAASVAVVRQRDDSQAPRPDRQP
jgi:hypothetical protein